MFGQSEPHILINVILINKKVCLDTAAFVRSLFYLAVVTPVSTTLAFASEARPDSGGRDACPILTDDNKIKAAWFEKNCRFHSVEEADERSSDEKSFISTDTVKTVDERSRMKEARTSFIEFISSF